MMEQSESEPIGLVLSGGGAKGAFQAGVWKAMCEKGIAERVRVISGTSVGAINGVAIALLRDWSRVRDLWFNHVQDILSPNFDVVNPVKVIPLITNAVCGAPFPFQGVFSRPCLVALMEKVVSRCVSETGIDVYATALACRGNVLQMFDSRGYRVRRFHLNDERSPGRIRQMLLASSAIPWGFDPVDIDGVRYVDGSFVGGDNVPIAPILENHPEIKTIYVVRCNSRQIEPFAGFSSPERRIVEICPRQTLPGILDGLDSVVGGLGLLDGSTFKSLSGDLSFDADYARTYFEAGYSDGLHALSSKILDAELKW